MLSQLHLQNFKCYNDAKIDFSNLTVFTGINSSGKSTALQAILLLRQLAFQKNECGKAKGDFVEINGELLFLGTAKDVLPFWASEDDNGVTLQAQFQQRYMGEPQSFSTEITLFADRFPNEPHQMRLGGKENIVKTKMIDFAYLSAERIGPRASFDVPSVISTINPYGNKGENTAYMIVNHGGRKLPNIDFCKKISSDEYNSSLNVQLENCYKLLGKEIRIQAVYHQNVEKVALEISTYNSKVQTWNVPYRPLNVGFGLTYTLPIFTSLLLAKQGDMVIIENPEAHLHPKGQVAMGQIIAWGAASGVQVIIETHSDHILNGIRLAVKNGETKPEDVQINFVVNDDTEEGAQIVSPKILPDGMIDIWPEGFFDEFDKTLAELF